MTALRNAGINSCRLWHQDTLNCSNILRKKSSEEHPLQRSFRVKAFAASLYYGHLRVSQQKPYDYPSYFTPFFFPNYLVLERFCTESLV